MSGKAILGSVLTNRRPSWPLTTMLAAESPEMIMVWTNDLESGLRSHSLTPQDAEQIQAAHNEATKLGAICILATLLCMAGIWCFTGRSV